MVKARGLLESFNGRLSLDDAVYISTHFTYEVTRFLMKEVGDTIAFGTGPSGPESGYFMSMGRDYTKYPQDFASELMDITKLLVRKPRKKVREEKE